MPLDVTLNDAMREGLTAMVRLKNEADSHLQAAQERLQRVLGAILHFHGNGSDYPRMEILDIAKGTIRLHEPDLDPVKPGTVLSGGL